MHACYALHVRSRRKSYEPFAKILPFTEFTNSLWWDLTPYILETRIVSPEGDDSDPSPMLTPFKF